MKDPGISKYSGFPTGCRRDILSPGLYLNKMTTIFPHCKQMSEYFVLSTDTGEQMNKDDSYIYRRHSYRL
jgi:hypothetical protein